MRSAALLDACANIARALTVRGTQPALTLALPEANSLGVALLGGSDVGHALDAVDSDTVLLVVENDLYRRAPAAQVDAALARARCVVVIDHQLTPTAERAHLLLPAASFAEGDGTLVNNEGRAQRFFQVYDPAYYNLATRIRESWRWLAELFATGSHEAAAWRTLDEITAACASAHPELAAIVAAAPDAVTRVHGRRVARQPPRYSGRTAMRADVSVHEPRAPQDPDSALAFSMEGYAGPDEPGPLIPFAWSPGWNSPQSWNKFQDEVGGHLRAGDPGVRLLESDASGGYAGAPAAPAQGWQVAPLHHLFGSEELSARAEVVRTLVPAPYVALHPDDAAREGFAAGSTVRVELDGQVWTAPLVLRPTLAAGVVGIPAGLPGTGPVLAGTGARLQSGDTP
ncbi:MAG: NADH-quinone oxidoreductase subunit G [Pseudomonadales bacterium]|nr:NADH-quinone oxidoreductase subunit G [Pseudomonadales bacterium]